MERHAMSDTTTAAGNTKVARPTPLAEDLARPYWDGARRGQLILQQCSACGKRRHYPQVLCSTCYSDRWASVEASGRGKVHSWTITHHAFHPAFAGDLPYALLTVDLDEGVRALGLARGIDFASLRIGLPVKASFAIGDDGFGRLTFVPG
ncbi:MAG: Zn-ribbon domain-containing OB-fold protein [Lautropia sp.]